MEAAKRVSGFTQKMPMPPKRKSVLVNVEIFGSPNPTLFSFGGQVHDFFVDLGGAPFDEPDGPSIWLGSNSN
jgi:hypothetical protein